MKTPPHPDRLRSLLPGMSRAGLVAAAVLVAGFLVSVALNLPGQLSFDSVAQLHDGRFGFYSPWHPLIMAWMLGISDSLTGGAGLFVVFNAFLLFASMVSCLWLAPRARWPAVAIAAICCALPQFVLYQGIVWKDVLFADAAVAGFACLAQAGQRWRHGAVRWGWIIAAFQLFALAALARQNGAVALVVGAMALTCIAHANAVRWRYAICWGAVALVTAFVFVFCAGSALATRTNGLSGPKAQIALLQLYDLVGAVKAEPSLALDRIDHANPDLDEEIRSDGVALYTPERVDTLVSSADLQGEFNDTQPAVVGAQWWDLVWRHPWLYLDIRARVFAWVFLTPDISKCLPYYTGVDGPPALLRDLRLVRMFRPQDRMLGNYASHFLGTPVFSHATFAILAGLLIAFLLRRGRAADLAFAFMLIGAMAFALSFFVISIACDYRYLLFLDLSALVALFYVAATSLSGKFDRPSKGPGVERVVASAVPDLKRAS
jgi:hypothetical protein